MNKPTQPLIKYTEYPNNLIEANKADEVLVGGNKMASVALRLRPRPYNNNSNSIYTA